MTATCVSNATYSISVAVTGLSGTLVVQDNTGAALTFTTNSTQTFSNTYTSGSTYSVTVQTQPAGQTCTLSSNSSGTITSNITVTATCVANATYTISVAVTGLTGTLVVQDNIGAALTFTTNNTQTFSNTYTSGSTYSVSVQTQPAGQTCLHAQQQRQRHDHLQHHCDGHLRSHHLLVECVCERTLRHCGHARRPGSDVNL